jgi:outer membrane protein OmpA-like peptidoglycan-associated protein
MLGDADYNKKLALQRATNVRDFMQAKVKDAKYDVFGVGESVQIFDNKTTTGRQLSRTVQVYVITPKN